MRPRRDIDDLDDSLFDRDEAAERRRRREEERALAARRLEQEAALDAAQKVRAREFTIATNERQILAEYAHHGLRAPLPLVSLALLLKMGWRLEKLGLGVNRLVAPPAPGPYTPTERDNS